MCVFFCQCDGCERERKWGALHLRMWGSPAVFKVRLSVLLLKIQDHLCLAGQLRREKKNLHLKQDKSLCFYPFNVVAPVSHWLINETQESSSGTEECQPKAFDPLTFIRCAPAKMPKSDPCLHAFNGPRRALLTVLPFSEGQLRNCTAEPWKPSEPHPRPPPQQSGNIVTLKQGAY